MKYIIQNIEEIISGIAVVVMLFAMGFNVIARYVFVNPTSWSDELSIIALSYVTFLGSAAAFKRNAHFGMDFLVEKFPPGARLILRRILGMVLIVLFAYTTYLGCDLTRNMVKTFAHTRWSYKWMSAALPMGFFSMTFYSIYYFILSFRDPKRYTAWYERSGETAVGEGHGDDGEICEKADL